MMGVQTEGIFCEPAAAKAMAGLLKLSRSGAALRGKRVVCVVTGTGLKNPDLAAELGPTKLEEYPPDAEIVAAALSFV